VAAGKEHANGEKNYALAKPLAGAMIPHSILRNGLKLPNLNSKRKPSSEGLPLVASGSIPNVLAKPALEIVIRKAGECR
jgi:hypothetical protein